MIDEIITAAAEVFEIDRAVLLSTSRKRHVVWARQALALAAYERGRPFGLGVTEIGRALGQDHTTICYSKEKAAERALARPDYAALLGELMQAV